MQFKRCTFKAAPAGSAGPVAELVLVLKDVEDVTSLAAYVGQQVTVEIWAAQQQLPGLFTDTAAPDVSQHTNGVDHGNVVEVSAGRRRRGTRANPVEDE
jgi:hypothetical protein